MSACSVSLEGEGPRSGSGVRGDDGTKRGVCYRGRSARPGHEVLTGVNWDGLAAPTAIEYFSV